MVQNNDMPLVFTMNLVSYMETVLCTKEIKKENEIKKAKERESKPIRKHNSCSHENEMDE